MFNYNHIKRVQTYDIHLSCCYCHPYRVGGLFPHPGARDLGQNQRGGQNYEKLVQVVQTQMVKIREKIILFLLSLQETHQRTLLGHPGVQKMRNNNPQNMQIHPTPKTRLQIHSSKKQRNKNIPSVAPNNNNKKLKMFNLHLNLQRHIKLLMPMVRQIETQQLQRIENRM